MSAYDAGSRAATDQLDLLARTPEGRQRAAKALLRGLSFADDDYNRAYRATLVAELASPTPVTDQTPVNLDAVQRNQRIGTRLTAAVTKRRLSRDRLAQRVGMNRVALDAHLAGTLATVDGVLMLADELRISIEDLFRDDEVAR